MVYVSNTFHSDSGGGGSGVNSSTFKRLSDYFEICNYLLIMLRTDFYSKIKSVLLKKLKVPRNYHHFSETRLRNVESEFENLQSQKSDADFYFFHGFTQWIKTKPNKPYFCFNDGSFYNYLNTSNNPSEFSKTDIERIMLQEKAWFENAEKVFFRSQWALDKTITAYDYKRDNFINVGVGGAIQIPERDVYEDGYNFLFISTDFLSKGGQVVIEAFKKLRAKREDVNLWIVGDATGMDLEGSSNVTHFGFLKKNDADNLTKLSNLFENTFVMVYPTVKDMNPLVLVELSYFGCPIIASNQFAIPEYLIDGETGFLINNPEDIDEVSSLMDIFLDMPRNDYQIMRKKSREIGINRNNWDKVVESICTEIYNSLENKNFK